MINNRIRCDICQFDIHRASYSRHLKSRKHAENKQHFTVNIHRKRVVKEDIKVSNTKVENQYYFTDRILKIAYDINIENHHDKHANSIIHHKKDISVLKDRIFD